MLEEVISEKLGLKASEYTRSCLLEIRLSQYLDRLKTLRDYRKRRGIGKMIATEDFLSGSLEVHKGEVFVFKVRVDKEFISGSIDLLVYTRTPDYQEVFCTAWRLERDISRGVLEEIPFDKGDN